jgi:uncharacterized RDD family membrane protein YckC
MADFTEKQSAINVETGQGFEFELEIAGLGARAYAFTIDWHIRILVALLWVLATLLIINLFSLGDIWTLLLSTVPAAAFYFLYHPVLEVIMQGNTPGKRKAKVRVVTVSGGVPSTGEILVRNLMRMVDSMPVFYIVGITMCLFTKEQRRIGDIAAGTLLVYDKFDDSLLEEVDYYLQDNNLTIEQQRITRTLLDRWDELEDGKRISLGGSLLEKLGNPLHPNEIPTDSSLPIRNSTDMKSKLQSLLPPRDSSG